MLELRALSKRYGERIALDSLSFALPAGCFAVLLGPNGAGKSTLFQVLTGLFAADGGEAAIAGHSLRSDAVRALARIGVVFQQTALDLDLSVRTQPALPRRPARPAARAGRSSASPRAVRPPAWAASSRGRCASCPAATGARWNWCARCCTDRSCC